MKSKITRFFKVCCLAAFCLSSVLSYNSFYGNQNTVLPTSVCDEGIVPYADVIVTKFRIYKGVNQYRRWNETRGYWVDPDWIDMV